jgi:YHS domain-containing protein
MFVSPSCPWNLSEVQFVISAEFNNSMKRRKDWIMIKYFTAPIAGALALGFATTGLAATGEFDNMCAMGLATDQKVETDCSVNATYEGKTYCFGNEAAKEKFMENPEENLTKAKEYYEEEVEG